eukprot:gene9674-1880_t
MTEETSNEETEKYSDETIYMEQYADIPNEEDEKQENEEIQESDFEKHKFVKFLILFCQKIEFIRFGLSGSIGTVLFYIFYELLYRINPVEANKATTTWAVSYLASIIWQHALHRYLVFGWKGTSYFGTLFWTYISYSLSIVMSPVIIYIIVDKMGVDYRIGWFISLCATGVFNYITLSMANQKEREKDLVEVMNFKLGYIIQNSIEKKDIEAQVDKIEELKGD